MCALTVLCVPYSLSTSAGAGHTLCCLPPAFGVCVQRLGFGIRGLEFGDWGLGFGVWGLGFGVWGLGFGVRDLGFGGLGFIVWFLLLLYIPGQPTGAGQRGRTARATLYYCEKSWPRPYTTVKRHGQVSLLL